MKYCVKCGHENKDEAKFCEKCGYNFETNTEFSKEEQVETVSVVSTNKKNTLGKVSFILGLVSVGLLVLCCCFPVTIITAPIALITGIISLVKAPSYLPRWQAITGIVLGAVVLLISIILFASMGDILDYLEQYIQDYCNQYPNSDECLTYKEAFPDLFD